MNLADTQETITAKSRAVQDILGQKKIIESDINTLSADISGRIAPSGQIIVICGDKRSIFSCSSPDKHESINISLYYDKNYGLVSTK
jgi:hypothetical protein